MINYKKLTVALICGTILTFPIAGCGLTAQTTENTAATTQQGHYINVIPERSRHFWTDTGI